MRVSPPDLLKIDRATLLRDVKERLAERAPGLVESLDPSHPAWILLEEAAWMVETLSEQLDDYPWAILQQFAHLLGAQLQPATPAMGVVVVQPIRSGRLELRENPGRWRFLTPQNEERGLIEFSLAEDEAPVVAGEVAGLAQVRDGELWRGRAPSPGDAALPELSVRFLDGPRSRVFDRETFRYTIRGADADRIETEMKEVAAKYAEDRSTGWIRLEVQRPDRQTVELLATIDVALAFEDAPEGETGDVIGRWGPLDEHTWTPPVRIADHPLMPPSVRGQRPLPTDMGLLVADVPANMLRNELLQRDSRPAPSDLPGALWVTLAHLDRRLAPLKPQIARGVVSEDEREPGWVDAALRSGTWFHVVERANQTIAEVALKNVQRATPVRIAWARDLGPVPTMRAFSLHPRHGLVPGPLDIDIAWEIDLPARADRGMIRLTAVEVTVPEGSSGLLVTLHGHAHAVLLNPCLVLNAPLVRDGRRITVSKAIPEPVSLLHKDIVTTEVLDRLASSALHPAAAAVVRKLPVSRATATDQEDVVDFEGMAIDAAGGTITLNAPDEAGRVRRLRRGDEVRLLWYRRTHAEVGNVGPNEISLVEQGPNVRPRLVAVTNPLGTALGAARELDQDAVGRVFGPQMSVPVTPADWERVIRHALGSSAADWVVRVWGYAERTMMSSTVWPPHSEQTADPDRARLERELESAGPEVLLVVLGPRDRRLGEEEMELARQTVGALIARMQERIPTVRDAVVTRFWPLAIDGDAPEPFPRFALHGVSGTLVDDRGRRQPVPRTTLLLNAAIVEVRS